MHVRGVLLVLLSNIRVEGLFVVSLFCILTIWRSVASLCKPEFAQLSGIATHALIAKT